jgi:hypothetical protein
MYNSVLQQLNLNLEVVYPISYIQKAIPLSLIRRDRILIKCRELLFKREAWSQYIEYSLFYHPRQFASEIFD